MSALMRGASRVCPLQVLGDTWAAYNLTPDDVLISGKNGMLISGPNARKHEHLLVQYLAL
eukprot:SAG11_NODE_6610_length_1279_cov_2.032203_1_plen_59_part_10